MLSGSIEFDPFSQQDLKDLHWFGQLNSLSTFFMRQFLIDLNRSSNNGISFVQVFYAAPIFLTKVCFFLAEIVDIGFLHMGLQTDTIFASKQKFSTSRYAFKTYREKIRFPVAKNILIEKNSASKNQWPFQIDRNPAFCS
ncbi:hypothetical protein [Parasphingorhabdus cellanae]|uniref:Uncharacterized protein n=1 Tax=Parasphingorhabdus cellanae TaxID=2806553 RepID=A0ABX7T6U3_9SPHN|nr:hypothetical protein [Parasphingorhabdus cellanae]QTD57308.1 hypothetical protein J4G78_07190 [Parasphingorhabdus cellanae]